MIFGDHAILSGTVVHDRIWPVRHRLKYGVFSILVDLDRIGDLNKTRLFSVGRANLLSFHVSDMADGKQLDLAGYARKTLLRETGVDGVARVWLLTFPRILGYVFNPLSVYFCLDRDGQLVGVIHEVSNTFGDRTRYVSQVRDGRIEGASKQMLVSPFNGTSGRYGFSVHRSNDELTVGVSLHEGGQAILKTHLRGKVRPFSDWQIVKMSVAYPLMTLKVMLAIHLEAAKLWLKGLRFPAKVGQARKTNLRTSQK